MLLVDSDFDHLGRAQRLGYEGRGVLGPLDDIDLLAAKLRHDSLDARPALPDGCPDRIQTLLARRHGNL